MITFKKETVKPKEALADQDDDFESNQNYGTPQLIGTGNPPVSQTGQYQDRTLSMRMTLDLHFVVGNKKKTNQ